MQILIDGTVFQRPATGIAKATLGLYKACVEQAENLDTQMLHRRPLHGVLPDGIQSTQIGKNMPQPIWRNFFLPMHLLRTRPAAMHFPWNGNVPRISALIPVITTYHDVLPLIIPKYFKSDRSERMYRKKVQRDLDRTNLLITDSEYSAKQIASNFKIETEPTVIYLAPFLEAGDVKPVRRDSYFLYVGGWDRRKGLEPLLETFLGLRRDGMLDSKLVIVGKRERISFDLDRMIEEGEEMGEVETTGYISDAELLGLYAGAVALVYPSKYEGFGFPPLEAMSTGCPVITTKFTSIPEVCGDAVLYADPDSEKELALAMGTLETNGSLRNELKAKGRVQAGKFSWAASAEKFLSKVTEVCCNTGWIS